LFWDVFGWKGILGKLGGLFLLGLLLLEGNRGEVDAFFGGEEDTLDDLLLDIFIEASLWCLLLFLFGERCML
jgi:hypothetical protein